MKTENNFLANGGECGAIIRSVNWQQHPLGEPSQWPSTLRTCLGIILHSKFPMFLFWGSDHICFYNDAYRPSLGNSGKHPKAMGNKGAVVWPEIWPVIKPQIDQVMMGGDATWHEDQLLPIYRNNTLEDVYWTYSYSPVKEMDGTVAAVFVTCNETTGKVQAEQALTAAYTEKNQILESISDGFFATDCNWKVNFWNSTIERISGISRERILGKNIWEVYRDIAASPIYNLFAEALQKQETAHLEEFYEPLSIWVEINVYPNAAGISVYVKDITERKNQEVKLQQLTLDLQQKADELSAKNAELERFVNITSHDLKEPLRTVNNLLGKIKASFGEQLGEKALQYIQLAGSSARNMYTLVEELLNYCTVGGADHKKEVVDLNLILKEVTALQQSIIAEKDATIIVDNLPVIMANKTGIKLVFQNLVSNALKYQSPNNKPVIKISAAKKNDNWEMSVEDNGIGISPANQEKVFQLFQRLHTKNEYPGTGLGLATCKKIIEQHEGKIGVESELGKGTKFYFTIKTGV